MAVDLWHSALVRLRIGHERAALTGWISFSCLILYHMLKAADIRVSERLLIPSTTSLWIGQGALDCILGGTVQDSSLNRQASHRIPNGNMAHKLKWTHTNGFPSLTLRQRGKCFHIPVWSCRKEEASSDSTWHHGSEIRVAWAWSHVIKGQWVETGWDG